MFKKNERGAVQIEYAIGLAIVALCAVAGIRSYGHDTEKGVTDAGRQFSCAAAGTDYGGSCNSEPEIEFP